MWIQQQQVIREVFMTKTILIAALATLLSTACSLKSDDAPPAPPVEVVPEFKNEASGFNVEGSWTSSCNLEYNRYRQRKMIFSGQNFQRSNNLYFDYKCAQIDLKDESKGIFRWLAQTVYGGFSAEYKVDLGGGWSQLLTEEILLENGMLYISGYGGTGYPTIEKSHPMKKE